jgi:hypothetical protein
MLLVTNLSKGFDWPLQEFTITISSSLTTEKWDKLINYFYHAL